MPSNDASGTSSRASSAWTQGQREDGWGKTDERQGGRQVGKGCGLGVLVLLPAGQGERLAGVFPHLGDVGWVGKALAVEELIVGEVQQHLARTRERARITPMCTTNQGEERRREERRAHGTS